MTKHINKHTDKPWFYTPEFTKEPVIYAETESGKRIAIAVPMRPKSEEGNANGFVLASARDMLSFVSNLRDLLDAGMDDEVIAEVRGDFCTELLSKALNRKENCTCTPNNNYTQP